MLNLDQIAEMLADRRIDKVAEATGLSRGTIVRMRDRKAISPEHETVRALSDYLEGKK